MKPLVKSLCAVLVLGATGVLLLADSAEKCPHAKQSASFAISEGCGPAGTLSISVPADVCYFQLSGADALQLPAEGRYWTDAEGHRSYDLVQGTWQLTGTRTYATQTLADAGWPSDGGDTFVNAARECFTSHEGDELKLRCTDRAQVSSEPEPRVLGTCEATVTPL